MGRLREAAGAAEGYAGDAASVDFADLDANVLDRSNGHAERRFRRSDEADGNERVAMLGVEIDRVDMAGAVERCETLMLSGGYHQHMAVNAAKLVHMQGDATMRDITSRCDVVTADGQSVVWASRLLGEPLPERVAGIDLMEALLALAATRGYGVYILGAGEEVLEQAVANIRAKHPGIRVVGHQHGYFSDEDTGRVAADIRAAAPDLLFVAMSSPRKEYFLGDLGPELGVPFAMGVGGSIDVIAGKTRRAPRWMQTLCLEWFYRMAQEPRRLVGRYASTNWRFLALVMRDCVKKKLRRRYPSARSAARSATATRS